jgi:seryl-tRNA synthetase
MNVHVPNVPSIQVDLPHLVDQELAGDIEKESVFVSPYLDRIVVNHDLRTARLIPRPGAPIGEVVDKATRYIQAMAKQVGGFETRVFLETERRDGGDYERDVDAGLLSRGWMHDYGKGQVAYSGPVLKLARLINEKAGQLYATALGAMDGHFPSLIGADTLHKCGYFDSHPNAVTFVGNVIEDFDALEEFRRANACSEGALLPPHGHIQFDGLCLNPAACFPCYPSLSGRTIAEGECCSWLGRVFRYESRNISGLDRLYEFNVRELVFVGDEDYVRACRAKALPIIEELATYFDLDCRVQSATDPFFATVSAAKKFWQAAQEVKNEIKIPVLDREGRRKLLACGSVNLHGNFFGKRFDIKSAGLEPAQTGCVGLGIERWVLATFTQHGFDEARWPEPVRRIIFA